MCGRFSYGVTKEELADYVQQTYQISTVSDQLVIPRYNVAPSQPILAIIHDGKHHRLGEIKWGFIPSYATDESVGFSMINARAESIREKFAFQKAFKERRCVILADGFYEWNHHGKEKTPYRLTMKKQKMFSMAGLWSSRIRSDGTKQFTCTIVTCEANELLASIHDRMPVILDREAALAWMNPAEIDGDYLQSLLKPYPSMAMSMFEVSTLINQPQFDSIECIQSIKKSPNNR